MASVTHQTSRWATVRTSAVLFVCLFAAQSAFLVLGPILPAVADEFETSSAAAGQLRTFSGIAGGVTALALAAVARRVRLVDLLSAGLWLLLLASVASALAPSFAILAIAQLAIGVGIAILLSGAVAAAAEWTPPETRSRVLAWALVGQPAAWVVGMPAIGIVAGLGWRYAWLSVPAVASATALFALRLQRGVAAPTGPPPVARPAGYDRAVAGWALGELLAYAGWSGLLVYSGALLLESYETSPATCGLLLGIGAAAYFPGAFLARRWVDRHSRRMLIVLGLALSVSVACFGTIRPGLGYSAVVFAMAVFVAGARTLAGSTHGLTLASGGRVTVTSIRAAATQFGNLLGVGLGGAALAAGGYDALGLVLASLLALAVVPHVALQGHPEGHLPRRPEPEVG